MLGVEDINSPGTIRRNQYLVRRHGQLLTNIETGLTVTARIRSDDHIEVCGDADLRICDTFVTPYGELLMVTDGWKYRPGIRIYPIRRNISFADLYNRSGTTQNSFGRKVEKLTMVQEKFAYFTERNPNVIHFSGDVPARPGDVVELHDGICYEIAAVQTWDGMSQAIVA